MENLTFKPASTLIKVKDRFNKNYFENEAWAANHVICGLDEVGRGCLAGPVVTAAVILPRDKQPSRLLKDSKIMTPEERLKAFEWIDKNCIYSVGIVHHRIVDSKNVYHATLVAMKKALVHLLAITPEKPSKIVIDAMPLNLADTSFGDIPVHYFPFGERRSSSIAAASIVAKVKRDAMMARLDTLFPGYLLASHKGYSTPPHKQILREGGNQLIIHRNSFLGRLNPLETGILDDSEESQQSLFDQP